MFLYHHSEGMAGDNAQLWMSLEPPERRQLAGHSTNTAYTPRVTRVHPDRFETVRDLWCNSEPNSYRYQVMWEEVE